MYRRLSVTQYKFSIPPYCLSAGPPFAVGSPADAAHAAGSLCRLIDAVEVTDDHHRGLITNVMMDRWVGGGRGGGRGGTRSFLLRYV